MSGKNLIHIVFIFILLLFISGQAQVSDIINIHGFGAWAAGMTSNENRFGFATKEGELNDYYFSLNLSSRPTSKLSINSQVFFGKEMKWRNVGADSAYARNAQILELDYLFIQYTFSSLLGFRLGKVKSPFGIYAEVYDVGTLRPFYYLPFSVYKGMFPKAYYGLGMTGRYAISNDFEINYDVVTGEIETQAFYLESPIISVSPPTFVPELKSVTKLKYVPVGRQFIGAKINVNPYISGLNVGLSYMSFNGNLVIDDGPRQKSDYEDRIYTVLGHIDYTYDVFNIKSEYYHVGGGNDQDINGGYLETSYRFADKWLLDGEFQIALQYESYDNKTASVAENAEMAPSTLKHSGYGLALNYWFNPNIVIKANYYQIQGNTYAVPVSVIAHIFAGKELEENTNVIILATQFSF